MRYLVPASYIYQIIFPLFIHRIEHAYMPFFFFFFFKRSTA